MEDEAAWVELVDIRLGDAEHKVALTRKGITILAGGVGFLAMVTMFNTKAVLQLIKGVTALGQTVGSIATNPAAYMPQQAEYPPEQREVKVNAPRSDGWDPGPMETPVHIREQLANLDGMGAVVDQEPGI